MVFNEFYIHLLFSIVKNRKNIPNNYIFNKNEANLLRKYLEIKNFPPKKYILHIFHNT